MSTSGPTSVGTAVTPEEIERNVERQRRQLGETVDALGSRLDVKRQAGDRVAALRGRLTTDAGRPRPEVLVAAGSLLVVSVALLLWRRGRS